MGGISIWQLLIIAAIVVLMFGTKKLRTLGSDLGASIKGFKKAMGDEESAAPTALNQSSNDAEFKNDAIIESKAADAQTVVGDEQKSQQKEQG